MIITSTTNSPVQVSLYLPIAAIAVVCHEANRAYCAQLGDSSQKSWDEAEAWQRESAIRGVEYALMHPDATPDAQHEAWCADKRADGWVHGPLKAPQTKEHPCLVPYDELPDSQKVKDKLFLAIVDTFRKPTILA